MEKKQVSSLRDVILTVVIIVLAFGVTGGFLTQRYGVCFWGNLFRIGWLMLFIALLTGLALGFAEWKWAGSWADTIVLLMHLGISYFCAATLLQELALSDFWIVALVVVIQFGVSAIERSLLRFITTKSMKS